MGNIHITDYEFRCGDYIQMRSGPHAGECGQIIGVELRTDVNDKSHFMYIVKTSDKSSFPCGAKRMCLLRREDPAQNADN